MYLTHIGHSDYNFFRSIFVEKVVDYLANVETSIKHRTISAPLMSDEECYDVLDAIVYETSIEKQVPSEDHGIV